jgi:hypothetical protein
MKKLTTLLSFLLLAACLLSQTRIPPGQVQLQATTGVYVNVTGGPGVKGMVLATVDVATLVLDTTGVIPVLRAFPQAGPPINEKHVTLKPAVGVTTLTIPDASYIPTSLCVYVNGILQGVVDDYTVAGTSITLLRTSTAGDVDQLTYRF